MRVQVIFSGLLYTVYGSFTFYGEFKLIMHRFHFLIFCFVYSFLLFLSRILSCIFQETFQYYISDKQEMQREAILQVNFFISYSCVQIEENENYLMRIKFFTVYLKEV